MNKIPTMLAYVDPGTGAMLLQMIVAGGLGLLFAVKKVRDRILGFCRRKKKDDELGK